MSPAARIEGASDSAAPAPLLLGPDRPGVVIHRPGIGAGAINEPPLRERRFLALLAVHGDEPCGVVAANRLLAAGFFAAAAADPSCPFDELRLVVGNPKALAAGVRFLDLNLNRCFKEDVIANGSSGGSGGTARCGDGVGHAAAGAGGGSNRSDGGPAPYEAARAAQLAPLIEAAGSVLDIHSTSVPTPPFAFYVPGDSGAASAARSSGGGGAASSSAAKAPSLAGAGPAAAEGHGQGQAQQQQQQQQGGAQEGVPPEAELALSLPVAYVVRDYTGAGQGLAIEWAAAAAAAAGAAVRASCVECGSHQDPASVEVAEACLRAFATAGGTRTGEPGSGAAAAPRHVVARSGVIVRAGFRWLWGGSGSGSGGGGAPPPAFAHVAAGQVVAADDEAGDIACPCAGGALVFMPAGAPRVGEDALLWAEDYP
ncbi:hypothetical protein MNEG_3559 [Monoraphidium neglectum]|uniref:Succinylglutamate desuccinylase/Aspartoacylase catalytic domain-containing protein n=1 Tax=Monoraphidium neglectum TaxID=145388 RepID=A0A0D2MV58_9CHLO|nr:hypothetical protein MNEG_3559 [Monoraphidium neglectum]KIZ04402.1 hypothetical protein MNEG_3559 [Monoraphidium neglectum]|eukprot:XP_013903421.1 hypothetical protein MNEG_3559 [Monoraphidium neglectum]